MRIIPSIVLTATLFLSSYAGTVTLPNNKGLSFRPDPPNDIYYTVTSNPPSCPADTVDFFWSYYEGCTCMCLCCPAIRLSSNRAFYVSKQAMDCSSSISDTAKLADTSLFVKCTTSVSGGCPVASIVLIGPYGLVPGGVDDLYTRLLVFRTKYNNYLPQRYVPLKIDRVFARYPNCMAAGMSSTIYDSIQVSFGNSLACTEISGGAAPVPRSSLRFLATGQGYVISGFGEGNASLEIVNAQGKTVYCRPVASSPAVIGKNALGPGIYFIRVRSQAGVSSVALPVY
jgi:hypothetical protein